MRFVRSTRCPPTRSRGPISFQLIALTLSQSLTRFNVKSCPLDQQAMIVILHFSNKIQTAVRCGADDVCDSMGARKYNMRMHVKIAIIRITLY